MKNYISTDKIGSEHVTVSRRSMFSGLAIGCALFLSACGRECFDVRKVSL